MCFTADRRNVRYSVAHSHVICYDFALRFIPLQSNLFASTFNGKKVIAQIVHTPTDGAICQLQSCQAVRQTERIALLCTLVGCQYYVAEMKVR